jgi:hypothetical protein
MQVFFVRIIFPFSCFFISDGSLRSYKNSGLSDVLWSKLSSKHLTFPDHERFWAQLLSFKKDGMFLIL